MLQCSPCNAWTGPAPWRWRRSIVGWPAWRHAHVTIEYLFNGARRKATIGILDKQGAEGESISGWLDNGRLSLAQARAIAVSGKRSVARDAIQSRIEVRGAKRMKQPSKRNGKQQKEEAQPTVRDAVALSASKQLDGKKSAPTMRCRLDRLVQHLGLLQRQAALVASAERSEMLASDNKVVQFQCAVA